MKVFADYAMSFDTDSHDIKDFNIIPCGTIFLDDTSKTNDSVKIKDATAEYLRKKEFAKVVGICISQKAMSEFENFWIGKNMKEIMRLKQNQYFY